MTQVDIVKSVGSKSPLGKYLRSAVRFLALVSINAEVVEATITALLEYCEDEEWGICDQLIDMLKVIFRIVVVLLLSCAFVRCIAGHR